MYKSVKSSTFAARKGCVKNMTHKTQAIVLAIGKYSDNANILHLYTADNGRGAFMLYGNRYKGVLTPLSIVEVTTSKHVQGGLASVTSASLVYTPKHLNVDVKRQCVAMFIAEMLSLTVRHPMRDEELYEWLCGVVRELDCGEHIENLHLQFLIDYTVFLGIGIDEAEHPEWFVVPTSRGERQRHLKEICAYYEEHIEDFREPKSLDVLMEVFD